ncbi:MAG TPA: aldehyde dehydrogenase family protein [Acidobacteriaceae bacterium]|nr:aldehyde dehydrogenase family protein [Acidobacteriaceae bacterium]
MTVTTNEVEMHVEAKHLLERLGVDASKTSSGNLEVRTPITGEVMGRVRQSTASDVESALTAAHDAYMHWRMVPAPKRGELVRLLGEELRKDVDLLGELVTLETGKILAEGRGEVQEMIDICSFAAGLSRQLGGPTLPSERPSHRMMETWHPLGVVGVISAFNFPVAVWSWNAALALVCGDSVVWKPSEKTPLTALATHGIFERAAEKFGGVPQGLCGLLLGGGDVGERLVDSPLVPLVSATGSTSMGRKVAPRLASRFAQAILELGGNNAAIVCPSADIELTVRSIAFAAMGTAGQRCTTLRRLIVHDTVYDTLIPKLKKIYSSVCVGDPRNSGTLIGPLIDEQAYVAMQNTLAEARSNGANITGGERLLASDFPGAYYVRPALVEVSKQTDLVQRETFAPILYLMKYQDFTEAIRIHNEVPQGLSSSIFTMDMREAETFMSAGGSDCGIANVNIGTSGAEIGGAFGGEKETGGGRESGSDAWKQYMRRATNTINYGTDLPLAQGITFEVDA